MNCLVLDDEKQALEVLRSYSRDVTDITSLHTFTRPSLAKSFLNDHKIDLLFLDIQMPDITGLKWLRSLNRPYPVIFTTAFREYAADGYEVDAIDYLVKPIEFKRFVASIKKAERRLNTFKSAHIFIRSGYEHVKIRLENIVFVEAMANYVCIHLQDTSRIVSRMKMQEIEELLDDRCFVRVHRSYIVNIESASSVTTKEILLEDKCIPIGESYRAEVKQMLTQS